MAFGMKPKAGGGGGLNLAKAAMASKLVRFSTQFLKTIYICTNFLFFFVLLYFSSLYIKLYKSYTLFIRFCTDPNILWAGSPRSKKNECNFCI